MHGVLLVDKPRGPTSFDVVQEVRRALEVKKAGHTGTLDPMATGLLPVCVGDATRVAQFLTDADKAYEAVIALGVTTDTGDAQGQVERTRDVPPLTDELLEATLARFRGTFAQVPPVYSAIRHGGRRSHELARAGEAVELTPRQVTVHELKLRDFSRDRLTVSVHCTKGFFVRSLAFDVGEALGCGGHLTALRRTRTGPFTLDGALTLEQVKADPAAAARRLKSPAEALAHLPAVTVSEADARRVSHGGQLEVAGPEGQLVRVLGPTGALLAVAELVRGKLVYRRVLTG